MSNHPNVSEMRWIKVRGEDGTETIGTMPSGGVWVERADGTWNQRAGRLDAAPSDANALLGHADVGDDARIVARGGWS